MMVTRIQRRITILYNVTLFQERSGSWGIFTKNPVQGVAFLGREQDFAKPFISKQYAGGDPDTRRRDTARNDEYSELPVFCGLGYWLCFQVSDPRPGPHLDEPS